MTQMMFRIGGCVALLSCLFQPAFSRPRVDHDEFDGTQDRVYVMTNEAAANSVVVMRRSSEGSLTFMQEVETGGQGSGPGPLPARLGGGPGPNALTSSNSLVITPNQRFLIAANAGSNELSVLAITNDGLQALDKVDSGGTFPVSIAVHDNLVYVLNQRGEPNITGFLLGHEGKLRQIANSTQPAGSPGSSASEVAFSPNGRFLIVTETLANLIHVFRVGGDSRAEANLTFPSIGRTPSALAFTHHEILAVTEADEIAQQTGAPHGSSISSYRLTDEGMLEPISSAVPDDETASCWVRFTGDGRFAYVSSMGGGAITSFNVSPGGELSLLAVVAGDTGGPASVPLDIAITKDSKFLYVLTGLAKAVQGYRIDSDGSLVPIVTVGGFPVSIQGIVAR